MRRREVLKLIGGGAAAAWPMVARAQQAAMPVIGYLYGGAPQPPQNALAGFHRGLNEQGFIEGRNLAIVYRGTDQVDELPALAADLVRLPISAAVVSGNINGAMAIKSASATIPIVFTSGSDPVGMGLVASMNRPGGNVTGVTYLAGSLESKRLEMLYELVSGATRIGFLTRPGNARTETDEAQMQTASRSLGLEIAVFRANTEHEIDAAFAAMATQHIGGLVVAAEAFFLSHRNQIVALAARYGIPATYAGRDYTAAGGLMSYGDDRADSYRQAGAYIGRILKGEKPADLPVLQPTKFEFVINLKAAKALGITFPASFDLRADEVIE